VASERLLSQVEQLVEQGFSILGLSEFRSTVEWREFVPDWQPEPAIAPIAQAVPLPMPEFRQPDHNGHQESNGVEDANEPPARPPRRARSAGAGRAGETTPARSKR
jgi:hypothetical protein